MESLMSTEPDEGVTPGTAVGIDEKTTSDEVVPEPEAAGGERRRRNPLVLAGAILVAVALVCAVVFGVLWQQAANDSSLAFSKARDDVLRAAETGAANFTTLDYRNVQQGLDRWKQSATGDLYTQLTQGSNTFSQQVTQAKAVTSGKVREAAVTELDTHAGKAATILVVDVTVTPAGQKAQTKTLPLEADLTATDTGWKLSALKQLQIASTGQ
jgi:Mce-associated membrane protein